MKRLGVDEEGADEPVCKRTRSASRRLASSDSSDPDKAPDREPATPAPAAPVKTALGRISGSVMTALGRIGGSVLTALGRSSGSKATAVTGLAAIGASQQYESRFWVSVAAPEADALGTLCEANAEEEGRGRETLAVSADSQIIPSEESSVNISSLPADLLVLILSHLPLGDLITATEVCRRWNKVSQDDTLWPTSFSARGSELTTKQVRAAIRLNPRLSGLTLADRKDGNKVLAQVCQSGGGLTSLALVNCDAGAGGERFPSDVVAMVTASCPRLLALSVQVDLKVTGNAPDAYDCFFVRETLGQWEHDLELNVRVYDYGSNYAKCCYERKIDQL